MSLVDLESQITFSQLFRISGSIASSIWGNSVNFEISVIEDIFMQIRKCIRDYIDYLPNFIFLQYFNFHSQFFPNVIILTVPSTEINFM